MIYYLLLDRKERYPSYEDEDLPPRNDVGQSIGGRRDPLKEGSCSLSFSFWVGIVPLPVSLVPFNDTSAASTHTYLTKNVSIFCLTVSTIFEGYGWNICNFLSSANESVTMISIIRNKSSTNIEDTFSCFLRWKKFGFGFVGNKAF